MPSRFRLERLLAALLALLFAGGITAGAAVFTVDKTADSGTGTLRQSLANASDCTGAPHTIAFDIPPEDPNVIGGVAIITPSPVALPGIVCAGTTIDGTTQTANRGNTNDVTLGTGGTVGTGPDGRPGTGDEPALPQLNGPEVEIVGSSLSGPILTVAASNVTVTRLQPAWRRQLRRQRHRIRHDLDS